jgi:TadE-like protein
MLTGFLPRWGDYVSLFRNEQGGALVEIALTLPIFLTVLLGIFKFGIAFSNQSEVVLSTCNRLEPTLWIRVPIRL